MRKVRSVKEYCLFLEIAVMIIKKISEGECITTAQYITTCQIKYLGMFIYSAVLITPKFIHGVDLKSVVPILILYVFIGYQNSWSTIVMI